jgi:hypothetical protein
MSECTIWCCGRDADWRRPDQRDRPYCRDHARPEHTWPVSDWALREVQADNEKNVTTGVAATPTETWQQAARQFERESQEDADWAKRETTR